MEERHAWDVWRPGRPPAWSGAQLGRRWELIRDSASTWTLRFVGAGGGVIRSDSGSASRISTVIRASAITGQARLRLLGALERPDDLGPGSRVDVQVN